MAVPAARVACYRSIVRIAAQDFELSRLYRTYVTGLFIAALLCYALLVTYAVLGVEHGWAAGPSAGILGMMAFLTGPVVFREHKRISVSRQCLDRLVLLAKYSTAPDGEWDIVARFASLDDLHGASDVADVLRSLPPWMQRIHARRATARELRWLSSSGIFTSTISAETPKE